MGADKRGEGRGGQRWKVAADLGSVGIEMGLAVGLCFWGGNWLDGEFETAPWFMIVGFVVGLGAAANAVYRVARKTQRRLRELDELEKDSLG